MRTVAAIKRTDRPDRAHWVPLETAKGYQLVSRDISYPNRNLSGHATFEPSLDKAGELIGKGFAIRMAEPGASSGDYIYPENLEIIWV